MSRMLYLNNVLNLFVGPLFVKLQRRKSHVEMIKAPDGNPVCAEARSELIIRCMTHGQLGHRRAVPFCILCQGNNAECARIEEGLHQVFPYTKNHVTRDAAGDMTATSWMEYRCQHI